MRWYACKAMEKLGRIGYKSQLFLLDAQDCGVPQRRKRVFIISQKQDYFNPPVLKFSEPKITFGHIKCDADSPYKVTLGDKSNQVWSNRKETDKCFAHTHLRTHGTLSGFNNKYLRCNEPCYTITTNRNTNVLYDEPRILNIKELGLAGTFPTDFNFCGFDPFRVVGMSVPPVLIANIAKEIHDQVLNRV